MSESLNTLPKQNISDQFESATSVTNKPSLLSSCRICLSSILDPASLACGHQFCEKCLNTYWHAREKPGFIVCPLCRTFAFDIGFCKRDNVPSTDEFRTTFEPDNQCLEQTTDTICRGSLVCLMLSILMPVFYFIGKLLRPPLLNLISFFSDLLTTLVHLI